MSNNIKAVAIVTMLIFTFAFSSEVSAWQGVRISQAALVKQTIKTTTITVVYHRPGVKGRTIFGELVPYGEHWRTGASEATTIEFSKDVTVNGEPLAAGRYGFLTIPAENMTWTLVFTSTPDVQGGTYEPENDVLVVETMSESADHEEYMSFSFPDVTPETGVLALRWDKLMIPINIAVVN